MKALKKIRNSYLYGNRFVNDPFHIEAQEKTKAERSKEPKRTDIINYLLSLFNRQTTYLEIGVRNPDFNYTHIKADNKYSVDPGVEFKENPVDFKVTSDEFFASLDMGKILSKNIKFDVIFVDGLHLAEQVDRDILNSLRYIKEDGFIVLHDCNPPTEWHAREEFYYTLSPSHGFWNGTTWKAFAKYRSDASLYSCCIDTDWGVGILSKKHQLGNSTSLKNPFYEYKVMAEKREEFLNLIDFGQLKKKLSAAEFNS
ncbi:MAG: class I SAM-dependent methyltransferase [Chitinophagaceae bacterium]|nr:MAG: class I SAM-dependent methyltransferase [Chitinophagaceae bacterium]